ncbi:trehalose-6-phosphate synthase [Natrialbaceae archaeon AArc-T1-2]|nr:trehalose-6-phosphate synthase [Natrialbaceae archaeon AArc-T1-2]WIV67194.1 trehalose-6-phosphate synthase [Natrialbaceae archaeon AArc-T1-2]
MSDSDGTAAVGGDPGPAPGSLIVVSNRQPYRHEYASDDAESETTTDGGATTAPSADIDQQIEVDRPTGGLTAGLDPVLQQAGGTWIAWGDGDADDEVADDDGCVSVPPEEGSYTLQRVWLTETEIDGYYRGFSNRVLWPLCHEFPELAEPRPTFLEWYRAVNRTFAEAVADHADEDAVVWLQDYHLGLAPAMVRERVPQTATIAQFWHVPWPTPAVFEHCPARRELLEGLLGNDLLGFHVDRYCEAFLDCVERFCPETTVDWHRQVVHHRDGQTRVTATPMGIDAEDHDRTSRSVDPGEWHDFRERHDIPRGNAIGLGVDRLDYSKGIPERLDAIERLLEREPGWRGEFTFVQTATPSRTEIPAYARHGEYVREEIDRINARFGGPGWRPIVYTEEFLPRETLCALYRRADAMIVSPLYDGMNLVAKEFVAASVDGDGTLVLSETAGAHETLGEFAYAIDPTCQEAFAETIDVALTAPSEERRGRMNGLRRRVFGRDLEWWMQVQFDELRRVHESATPRNGRRRKRSRSV